jgi:hypothetical protein
MVRYGMEWNGMVRYVMWYGIKIHLNQKRYQLDHTVSAMSTFTHSEMSL